MTITFITDKEYKTLLSIQKKHPILTYQNKDYDNFDRSKMNEQDKEAFEKVTDILKKSIMGFSRFQNFKLSKEGELRVRFQYDYDWTIDDDSPNRLSFIGVGYLYVDELKNGFRTNERRNASTDMVEG